MEETREGHPLRGSEHEAFGQVLELALEALDETQIDYVLIGGLSAFAYGRTRRTHDIDFLVRPEDARSALQAFEKKGFTTEETDQSWLYKGFCNDVMVDVIFRCAGDILLDEAMLHHARHEQVGRSVAKVVAPEDLILIKATAAAEVVPNHWYDALTILSEAKLDWDYLVERASHHGVRRVLSLLLFAQSDDLGVPPGVVRSLADQVLA